MHEADLVIHTAAALPLYPKHEIYSTDIDGTRNVIEHAHRAGIDRFIHISSSTAVYGVPDHHPRFEYDALIGGGPYGEAKIAAEEICAGYRDCMTVAILRPKSFIGPERVNDTFNIGAAEFGTFKGDF